MASRARFAEGLGKLELQHLDRAVALLWYYRQTQEYEERSASDLSYDLQEQGFPKPNVTRLAADLSKSRYTVRGRRHGTFQLDIRRLSELDEQYSALLDHTDISIEDTILPAEWLAGTRGYLERLVLQINGSYQLRFYDACAVLCRRLMESLIIEVYISQARQHEIQVDGIFRELYALIAHIRGDKQVTLGRKSWSTMDEIKQLGDTAAHDRTYITQQIDIDDVKARYRRLIMELLVLGGIKK